MSTRCVELAIVGAGVAGLAAARRATDLGIDFILLEAADRIGGRVHSVARPDGTVWDRGAHALRQPPINSLVEAAERHSLLVRRPWVPPGGIDLDGTWLPELDVDDIWHQIDEIDELARGLADGSEDAALVDLIDPLFPHSRVVQALLTHLHGREPERVSAVDASRYGSFEGEVPIDAGLGVLIDLLYGSLPVELNSSVRVIDWGSDPVRIDATNGLIEAERVLVTVSTGVLAGDDLVFAPNLPDDVAAAIHGLPLGSLNRVIFDIEKTNELGGGSPVVSVIGSESVSFAPARPGSGEIVGIVSSKLSLELEAAGQDAMISLVAEHALSVFGSGVNPRFDQVDATAWGNDSLILGANSVALPGAADARLRLAEGVDGRLLFAGEALSRRSFGTVHGAINTGRDAIDRIAFETGRISQLPPGSDNPGIFAFDF